MNEFKLVLTATFSSRDELKEAVENLVAQQFIGRIEPLVFDGIEWQLDTAILEGLWNVQMSKKRGKK